MQPSNAFSREQLLESKWRVPALRPDRVARPRLIRQLQQGLSSGRRMTLVSAPAGFGKTTLLSDWAEICRRPVAWLSLEESENDTSIFLPYLIRALSASVAPVDPAMFLMLDAPQPAALHGALAALLNTLGGSPPFLLVLDDFHLIHSPGVQQTVEYLIDHAPETMHVAIGTREDPALPLAKFRARGQISELRESDLRFTPGESEEFLNRCMNLSLSAASAGALEKRTEGWIAGLQLAAFAMQQERGRAEDFIAAFSGDHRFVMDYLVAEVLDRLSPDTHNFLRRTSILDRLCAPLCDAVAECGDSQRMLEELESSNIFLLPLDGQRAWFRYHRLFAEFLRARLAPPEESALHERAAVWLEAHAMHAQAVRHALAAGVLTGRFETAERIILIEADAAIQEGRVETLLAWLGQLPETRFRLNASLATAKGWALALSGGFDEAARYARLAEEAPDHPNGRDPIRAMVLLLRAFIALLRRGDYPETIRLAQSAIDVFGNQPTLWLPLAYWLLAEPLERMGQLAEAIATLRRSRLVLSPAGGRAFTDLVDMMLIYDLNLSGRRREALSLNDAAILARQNTARTPAFTLLLGRLAVLRYEANQLEDARKAWEQIEAQGNPEPYTAFAKAMAADLFLAQGDAKAALDVIERALGYARQTGLADIGSLLAARANLHLRRGDLEFVAQWAGESNCSVDEELQSTRLETHITFARFLLAQHSHEAADGYLNRLREYLAPKGMQRPLLSGLILSALCADYAGRRTEAVVFLAQAIQIAAPEGYVRAFLDEDRRLLDILPLVRSEDAGFVDALFAAVQSGDADHASGAERMLDPLSEREFEILRLIVGGLSNAEIAARLVIAVPTVKRHVVNIYGKLGVNSRTQAAVKAKQLGLLP